MKKQIMITTIIIMLVVICFSGCLEQKTTDEESKSETDIETVEITGIDQTQTINKPYKRIKLDITGIGNDITVRKETNLVEIELTGTDNIIRVSRNHSFTIDDTGIDNEIIYYD